VPIPKSDFYDFILPFVPGVEESLVNFAIMRAVREAAEKSGIIRQVIDIPVIPLQSTYDVPLPADMELAWAFLVRWYVDNTNVRIYPINDNIAEYMSTMQPAAPTAWRQVLPDQITLYPVPNEAGVIRITAMLKPIFALNSPVPDLFYDYREMIADGALALLYGAPGKPWTSKEASDAAYKNFAKQVLALRVLTRSGGMPNNSTMKGVATFGEQSATYAGGVQ
jgi:hypothetical protein